MMADGHTTKAVRNLQKGDFVSTGLSGPGAHTQAQVVAVIEATLDGKDNRGPMRYCELDKGFYLTPTHPLLVNGTRWIRPEAEYSCHTMRSIPSLFNIVLEEGPYHTVSIQGFAVKTGLKSPVGVPMLDAPYKLEYYKHVAQLPGYEDGYVRLSADVYNQFKAAWAEANPEAAAAAVAAGMSPPATIIPSSRRLSRVSSSFQNSEL